MTDVARRALSAGVATGVGSLPHVDAAAAARSVLDLTPSLPAVPQLPSRDAREGMLAQWLGALPEVSVHPDGSFTVEATVSGDPDPVFDEASHGGLLGFVDALGALDAPPRGVKAQVTGPLTLGVALTRAGLPAPVAFARAGELVDAWTDALGTLLLRRAANSQHVVVLDEPGLVEWEDDDPPIAREDAVDLLSSALAGISGVTGVHACGSSERRMAVEAGPSVVGFEVRDDVVVDGVALSRYLDGGGWIAWGAVPTDRPVGDKAEHWWKQLVALWCELTRAGCDPVVLRTQAVITPACGLAGHGEDQADRVMRLAVELGERAREQAVATRLSVGA
jgi:hypothetical protein